ncbi:MAG TPA: ATP-binding cassette domain-containing protein, partial [Actinospica sp.]|nr:ATP-binding cassette domain-containing protein [Actinospica sp.]
MPDGEATSAVSELTAAQPPAAARPAGHSGDTPALSVRGLSKAFGATQALWQLDLDIGRGEIHALLGENGSGKSTLIKSLSGYHRPDSGEVQVCGQRLTPGSAASSHALGCRFVHQDLGLIATETVLDNLCVGSGYATVFGTINGRAARRAAVAALERVGIALDPGRVVGTLSPTEQTA